MEEKNAPVENGTPGETAPASPEIPDIPVVKVAAGDLRQTMSALKSQGFRFLTTSCLDLGDQFGIYYHMDRDLELVHYYVELPKDQPVDSVSDIFPGGFVAENEMRDMFGVKVEGLTLDYGSRFLVTELEGGPPLLKSFGCVVMPAAEEKS
ncbi:MAG: NADH-quinone oxidoreductase subunit C [Fimbriimonadaceae bacterium]